MPPSGGADSDIRATSLSFHIRQHLKIEMGAEAVQHCLLGSMEHRKGQKGGDDEIKKLIVMMESAVTANNKEDRTNGGHRYLTVSFCRFEGNL